MCFYGVHVALISLQYSISNAGWIVRTCNTPTVFAELVLYKDEMNAFYKNQMLYFVYSYVKL